MEARSICAQSRPLSAETVRAAMGSYWQNLLLRKRSVSKPANRSHMLFENANPWLSHVRIMRCTVSIPSSLWRFCVRLHRTLNSFPLMNVFWTLHRSPINTNLRLPEPPLFLRLSKSNLALPLTSGSHRISCSLRWQVILKNQTASTRSGKKKSRKNSGRFLSRTFIW